MADAVRHRSDGVFALDVARDDLKSVSISSPQQGPQVDERAWSRCSRNQKSLPGRGTGEPICSGIATWSESGKRQEPQRTTLIYAFASGETEAYLGKAVTTEWSWGLWGRC